MVFRESMVKISITILNCFCISDCGGTCHADATCTDNGGLPTCVCNPGYAGDGMVCDGKYNPHMLDSKVQTNVQILMSVLRAPATLKPLVPTLLEPTPVNATQAIWEMEQLAQVSTIHTCWTLKFKPMCRY